jgi:hypothetical protein
LRPSRDDPLDLALTDGASFKALPHDLPLGTSMYDFLLLPRVSAGLATDDLEPLLRLEHSGRLMEENLL